MSSELPLYSLLIQIYLHVKRFFFLTKIFISSNPEKTLDTAVVTGALFGMQKFCYRFSGDRVKGWMVKRGLEIGDVARITGMTTTQVAALLGGTNPMTSTVERLADCLQVHPGKFFSREVIRNGG